jgi:hypothetical protein
MFQGRNLVIATMHKKEKAIAPILEKALGVHCFIPEHFNTDLLGTFTGEVERASDPLTTARTKCLMALNSTGGDLAIANEGSFGPHPSLYFANADEEIIVFIDKKNNLEIVEREISLDTNLNAAEVNTVEELRSFAEMSLFPSHGLIISNSSGSKEILIKGITNYDFLYESFHKIFSTYNKAYVETDMRAMYNPTRLSVIKKVTIKLITKILSQCPQCNTPGFGITGSKKGLPCSLCKTPTESVLSHIYTCRHCYFSSEISYPFNKESEDPMFCGNCNP